MSARSTDPIPAPPGLASARRRRGTGNLGCGLTLIVALQVDAPGVLDGDRLRQRRAEPAVRPLLGEGPRFGEDDGDLRVADLDARQEVGQEARGRVGMLQDGGVAVLDGDRGPRQGREPGELERQRAVVQAVREVAHRLALDGRDIRPVASRTA